VYVARRGGSSTPGGDPALPRAVTETAGFSRTSGFVDDTRAFCSIPARHDMSRRVDAGVLAQLVAEHRLDEEEAVETRSTS
jgi:glucuronate isomerase